MCWRGYVCEYELRDDQLFLDEVVIALDGPPPVLLGREPETPRSGSAFTATYRNLGAQVPFTGGLLLARDFIREHYVHMGFHPAWKYAEGQADLQRKLPAVALEPRALNGHAELWIRPRAFGVERARRLFDAHASTVASGAARASRLMVRRLPTTWTSHAHASREHATGKRGPNVHHPPR